MMRDMAYGRQKIVLSDEQKLQILDAIEECGTLYYAETHKKLPVSIKTVYRVSEEDKVFGAELDKAQKVGIKLLLEQTYAIADNTADDVQGVNKAGVTIYNHEAINRSKLKVDNIYRRAAIVDPTKYSPTYYKPTTLKIKSKFHTGATAIDQINILQSEIAEGKMPPETGGLLINSCQIKFTIEEFEPLKRKVAEMESKEENV